MSSSNLSLNMIKSYSNFIIKFQIYLFLEKSEKYK